MKEDPGPAPLATGDSLVRALRSELPRRALRSLHLIPAPPRLCKADGITRENQGSERGSDLPKVTQQVVAKSRQVSLQCSSHPPGQTGGSFSVARERVFARQVLTSSRPERQFQKKGG